MKWKLYKNYYCKFVLFIILKSFQAYAVSRTGFLKPLTRVRRQNYNLNKQPVDMFKREGTGPAWIRKCYVIISVAEEVLN